MNLPIESMDGYPCTIVPDQAGRRIDNFLIGNLKGVPKSRIYRMLRTGEVRVNGGRIRQDYRLKPGDVLRIPSVERRDPSIPPAALAIKRLTSSLLKDDLLYEDEALIVLNKPAGIPVHGGTGFDCGVIEALRALRPHDPYLELAHRLDRDTSGCLLIVKQPRLLRQIHEMFREGSVIKRYLTLVRGQWQGSGRIIDEGLRRNILRSGERMVQVQADGKRAQTWMTPIEIFAHSSLMEVKLLTGRTHQIRVHAAYRGQPVAGDTKYGDKSFNTRMRHAGLRHMFLHAKSLCFKRPDSRRKLFVEAVLPNDLVEVLERLRAEKWPL